MTALLRLRIHGIWLLLMIATGLSWQFGHGLGFGEGHPYAAAAVLGLAFLKIRFVFLDFMELRHAPRALRLAFEVWAVAACALLIGLYWSGL